MATTGITDKALQRRLFLQSAGLQALVAPGWLNLLENQARAAEPLQPFQRFPRMVHEFYVDQVRQAEQRGLRAKARLKTRDDAVQYVQSVQARIEECFGPWPERTPLKPKVTRVIQRQTHVIENVIFESRPGFPVTANLYLPRHRNGRIPGVVGTCGHSSNGKAEKAYQSFAQGLARQGCACLLYDPIGQGERLQYVRDDLGPRFRPGVTEHLLAGNQQFLVGEFFGAWRAWDGMRALDYLLTRPEIDPRHVGVTGNSGGGTMTTWLCGVERRWTMAAPSCFVTTFRRNMENELPADTEQCPPRVLSLNLDHDDFLAAMAPKPVIVLGKERDYFDARGTEEAYARLQRLYRLLEAEDQVSLFVGPTYHGYSQENREAMYGWFQRATGQEISAGEPAIEIEADQTLWCTQRGQVAADNPRTVFSFTSERADELKRQRGAVRGPRLLKAIRSVLKLPKRSRVPDFRILRYLRSRGYPQPHAISYAVETEPGIQAIVYRLSKQRLYSRPPRGSQQAILYVSHLSSDAELRDEPLIRELLNAEPDTPLFTCDVRGIGESQPETCGVNSFHSPYGCDYFYAIHGLMLDRPYLGQKTHDLLSVLDWLSAQGHTQIHLVGKGWGALCATFAAVLSDGVTRVTLKHALSSYTDVAQTEDYSWPLSTLLPDVLSQFDLPDCYAALKNKGLRSLEPWGPRDKPV